MYLLNRDDGSLRELGRSERYQFRVLWLAGGEQFIYGLTQPENRISLRRYDVASHSDTLVGELDGEYLDPIMLSPDERWLVTETRLAQLQGTRLSVFDLRQPGREPITLTDHVFGLSSSSASSPHWVDSNSLIYDTREQRKDSIIYRVDLPDGAPQEISRFEPDVQFYDHDWSPDGNWLALATPWHVTPGHIYLVSLTGGGTSELPVELPDGESICVGWFSQAEYDSGKANICDVYLGMG